MARPRIVEKDYYQFQQALRRAVDNGNRIDLSETKRWRAWVKEHHIKEASFKSFGAGMYEGLEPVIIDQDDAEKTMTGTVSWVSSTAEFTPKVTQTKEERVSLVYAFKVLVKNDGTLKIGMPGEVYFNQ